MDISSTAKQILEALENKDLGAFEKLLSEDFRAKGGSLDINREQALAYLQIYFTAFPDMGFNFNNPLESDGLLQVDFQEEGTHNGVFDLTALGMPVTLPASGKKISLPRGKMEFSIQEGKVTQMTERNQEGGGLAGILSQLGVKLPGKKAPNTAP